MSPQAIGTNVPAQPSGPGSGGRIAAALFKYLTEHPGVPVFRGEIAKELGLTEDQVRTNMSNLRQGNRLAAAALETLTSGQVWMWRPNAAQPEPEPAASTVVAKLPARVFGEIGKTREGDLILQGDDGTLWRATEL